MNDTYEWCAMGEENGNNGSNNNSNNGNGNNGNMVPYLCGPLLYNSIKWTKNSFLADSSLIPPLSYTEIKGLILK